MTRSSVTIHITPESKPSTPSWMGEVAAFAQVLSHTGILKAIQDQAHFARARFGTYDRIDFVAVLIGYAISGESTLLAFYERLAPVAEPFMALFGRDQLPHRSTLSRFLAVLDQNTVEALRTRFQKDLFARNPFASPGGLSDRAGRPWLVVDVDGTRQAARQRALPQTESLPAPHRRFDQVCAPGYQGRKRGEVVRTRTVILQAHTHQFLGTFGGPSNGDYRTVPGGSAHLWHNTERVHGVSPFPHRWRTLWRTAWASFRTRQLSEGLPEWRDLPGASPS
jgi:hypothetical protein